MEKLDGTKSYYTDYSINHRHWLTTAAFYIMDNFFSNEELFIVNGALSHSHSELVKGSIIAEERMNADIRDTDIHFLRKPGDLASVHYDYWDNEVLKRVDVINKNIFDFDLTGSTAPQYSIYNPNQHYTWHPDGPMGVMDGRGLNCIPKHLLWRKLSAVIMLSDPSEYEGGEFQILNPHNPPEIAINTLKLDKGSIILFPSFMAHRVLPVLSGQRRTLVYWFVGPRWK